MNKSLYSEEYWKYENMLASKGMDKFFDEVVSATDRGDTSVELYYWMARCTYQINEMDVTKQALNRGLGLANGALLADIHYLLFEVHEKCEELAEAQACLDKMVEAAPADYKDECLLKQVKGYVNLKLWKESIEISEKLVLDGQLAITLKNHRSVSFEFMQRFDEARELRSECIHYQNAVVVCAYCNEAAILWNNDSFEEAVELLERGIQRVENGAKVITGTEGNLFAIKGKILLKRGFAKQAICDFEAALYKKADHHDDISLLLGKACMMTKQPKRALKAMELIANPSQVDEELYHRLTGYAFALLHMYSDAVKHLEVSYEKADSSHLKSMSAHVLAQSHQKLGNLPLAITYSSLVMNHSDRYPAYISSAVSITEGQPWSYRYMNRFKYIQAHGKVLSDLSGGIEEAFLKNNQDDNELTDLDCFALLLRSGVKLPVEVPERERIQCLAWLYVSNNDWHQVFELVDKVIDSTYVLSSSEMYLWLCAAYEIGEPRRELEWFVTNNEELEKDSFDDVLQTAKIRLKDALEVGELYDGYLLKSEGLINQSNWPLVIAGGDKLNEIYQSARNAGEFTPWLERQQMFGLLTIWLLNIDSSSSESTDQSSLEWRSLIDAINRAGGYHYEDILVLLRSAIKSGVDYLAVLRLLSKTYMETENPDDLKRLSLLMAGTLLSNHFDSEQKEAGFKSNTEIVSGTLADISVGEVLRDVLVSGLIAKFGIAWAISYMISKPVTDRILKYRKESSEKHFKDLLSDIEGI